MRGSTLVGSADPLLPGKGECLLLDHAVGERLFVLEGAVLRRAGGWDARLKMPEIGKRHLGHEAARPGVLCQETSKGCK